jgi:predicted heme/steroid binding protein
LFVGIIAYGITGYGLTRGIISRSTASAWHLVWLGPFVLLAFIIHSGRGLYLFFRRKNFWNIFTKVGLPMFYLVLALFFVYLHFFYQGVGEIKNGLSPPVVATSSVGEQKVFTLETLKTYNGQNGQPAYVAIDGLVYDLSTVFKNGSHYGYQAGQDLSAAFHAEHSSNILSSYPVVGAYQSN